MPSNTQVPHRAHQQPLKFVDPRAMLDEGDKWQGLYQQIVVKAAR